MGPKPYAGTIPVFFGAVVRSTIERAAPLADGLIVVALDWDETRTKVEWYRTAGGTGTVVVNTIPNYPDGKLTPATVSDAVLADLDRAARVGADEMHISLNLGAPVPPDGHAERLEALAARLGLAQT